MTWKTYEDNIANNSTYYVATEFLGRGKYNKIKFTDLEKAKKYKDNVLAKNTLAKIIVYGIAEIEGKFTTSQTAVY